MSKILVLDDNRGICHLLEEIFSMDGHEVKAYSEIDSIDIDFEKFKPDIGIFDINMNSDMLKIVKKLKKLHPDMKKIFMSADEPDNKYKEYPFISKPFDILKLKQFVYDIIKEKLVV